MKYLVKPQINRDKSMFIASEIEVAELIEELKILMKLQKTGCRRR